MKGGPLARGDDVCGRACSRGFGQFDLSLGTERSGNPRQRGLRLGKSAGAKVAAGDRNTETFDSAIEQMRDLIDWTVGADGIVGVVPLHGVVGKRKVPA